MQNRAIRLLLCVVALLSCTSSAVSGQSAVQPDIYEHFVGTWAGIGVFFRDGVRQENPIKITITETKKKDGIRLEYDFPKTATADRYRQTKFLRLAPSKSTFYFGAADSSGNKSYKATELSEFVQSGFGKFIGSRKLTSDESSLFQEGSIERITFLLTKETLSYEWEYGSDETHMQFYSLFKLTRVAGTPG